MKARDNPFRVERLHQLQFRFLKEDMGQILTRLADLNFRGAIIGPHGSGKTTLLEELFAQMRTQGEQPHPVRFTEANSSRRRVELERWLAGSHDRSLLILDGAEQLTSREWNAVEERSQHYRGLIITTHRPGLLSTLYECRTSHELLAELIQELTRSMPFHMQDEQIRALHQKHHGNIRDCMRELYDRGV